MWSIGVVNTKLDTSSDPATCLRFEVKSSTFSFDNLIAPTICSDARTSNFDVNDAVTTTDGQNDCFAPCTCTRGNYSCPSVRAYGQEFTGSESTPAQ